MAVKVFRVPALPKIPGLPRVAPAPVKTEEKPGPPATWPGSDLEWLVADWLTRHRVPFQYQAPYLGGRTSLGGQVVDFVIEDRQPPLLLGVQGEYWHYGTTAQAGRSLLAKIALQAQGFVVVYVKGIDLENRIDFTLRSAMEGHQLFSDT